MPAPFALAFTFHFRSPLVPAVAVRRHTPVHGRPGPHHGQARGRRARRGVR